MFLKRILFCFLFMTLVNQSCLFAQSTDQTKDTITNTNLKQPPYVNAGDTIAIVAPSGILLNRTKEINLAIDLLKSWGLNATIGEHVFSQNGHFAGTDKERAADLQKALDNPNIKAIWCARGGYGMVRILDKLDFSKFKEQPKWVIGYSDVTALHNQIHNEGVESIHSVMCTSSLSDDLESTKDNVASFKDAIFGRPLKYTIKGSINNKTGTTSGQLVGGNLTLLHTMLGSKTSIDTNGKILFFEEIGEYAYHIDRMLQSLKRAGYFENCKGIIVGGISNVRENTTEFGRTIEEIILDVVSEYDFPVLFNFPAGHEENNRALILGRTIDLKVGSEASTVVFEN
jgi:muramoyltetrapeptide carboxypeptidase